MKSRYTRILSVLLCAALACSILAGCSSCCQQLRSAQLCQQLPERPRFQRSAARFHHPGRHLRAEPR